MIPRYFSLPLCILGVVSCATTQPTPDTPVTPKKEAASSAETLPAKKELESEKTLAEVPPEDRPFDLVRPVKKENEKVKETSPFKFRTPKVTQELPDESFLTPQGIQKSDLPQIEEESRITITPPSSE